MTAILDEQSRPHPFYQEDLLSIVVESLSWPALIRWYSLDAMASHLVLPEI
jgi:hypothetical protein